MSKTALFAEVMRGTLGTTSSLNSARR